MAQVSNLAQLQAAVAAREQSIEVTADIAVTSQISINYDATISGSGANYLLSKTASFSGSLLRVINGGTLTLQNITLSGEEAGDYNSNIANRSLVQVAGGGLYLGNGAVLQNNSSYQEGGGVYLSGNVAYTNFLVMSGNARISGCSSRTSGGGLMVAMRNAGDRVTVRDDALIENNTAANGGGIYFRSYVQGVGGDLSIADSVHIIGNRVTGSGGGICFSGYREGGSPASTLTIGGDTLISSNSANHGGGVYFYSMNTGDQLRLTANSVIGQNTVTGNGGGVCLTAPAGGANLLMDNAQIVNNTAGTGGGLYLLTASGAAADISGSTVTGNKAANGASGSGGGIWIQNNAADLPAFITLTDTTVSGNTSTAQGGGIVLNAGASPFTFKINGSTVSSNTAGTNGGGMLMGTSGGGTVDITESALSGNTSGGSGGGLYFANLTATSSRINLVKTDVSDNAAAGEGGGLRLMSNRGTLQTAIDDCTIAGNVADGNSGGGIWNGGTNGTLLIRGNTEIAQNSTNEGNGGGIYFNSADGSLTLSGGVKVTGNRADERASSTGNHGGGICVTPGKLVIQDQAEIADNSALKYGGGISADNQSFITMAGGNVHDNRSGLDGGGIWNHGGSTFLLTGGSVYANAAQIGGGLYNDDGSIAILSENGVFGEPSPNTAADYAPGIYNEAFFRTEGLRTLSNGLYIENGEAAARLQGSLADASVIQLDNSDYVTPNASGTPIVVGEATAEYPVLSQTDADAFRKPPAGFDGWEIRLNSDHTQILLAPANFSIHYENVMGATHSNPASYTVTTPDIILADPARLPGYKFAGWFDAPQGGNQVTRISQGSTGDITLYARWTAVYHTLLYYGNENGCPPARCIPSPVSVQDGRNVMISRGVPCRKGYRFVSWNSEASGKGTAYLPGQTVGNVTGNIALYAQWTACCPCRRSLFIR